jgi:hypothetical protein
MALYLFLILATDFRRMFGLLPEKEELFPVLDSLLCDNLRELFGLEGSSGFSVIGL